MVELVVLLLIGGVLLWALPQLPIDATIQGWIRVVILVVLAIYVVLFVASLFGAGPSPLVLGRLGRGPCP